MSGDSMCKFRSVLSDLRGGRVSDDDMCEFRSLPSDEEEIVTRW